jgi:hypothetical protein
MRTFASILTAALFFAFAGATHAQTDARHVDLEVEPLAYAFGGAGGHVAVQVSQWKYEVEVFGLEIPESLHGNDGFTASPLGAELHFERFFGDGPGGFYVGPEAGIVRLDLTHQASGTNEQHTRYSVGVRGGYQWYTGLGNLYVSPVVGVSYTLNSDTIEMAGEPFETAPVGLWGTIGIGWSFSR